MPAKVPNQTLKTPEESEFWRAAFLTALRGVVTTATSEPNKDWLTSWAAGVADASLAKLRDRRAKGGGA